MAQSDIMRYLAQKRLDGDGWTTIKELEEAVAENGHPRPVRKQVKRLVAYNFVETRAVSARLREFRIKERYIATEDRFARSAKPDTIKVGKDARV